MTKKQQQKDKTQHRHLTAEQHEPYPKSVKVSKQIDGMLLVITSHIQLEKD